MRLRIATAFALLFFAGLAIMLTKVSRVMPTAAPAPAQSFAFDVNKVSGAAAFSILKSFLEISPRDAGSNGAKKASEFISNQLAAAGLTPATDEFQENAPGGMTTFRNVSASIAGNGKTCLVLLSHYDTKSAISKEFTGANDSGSSTALLLHLAGILNGSTSDAPDIVIAFVDGEECMVNYSASDGLHGSRRLAAQLVEKYGKDNIKAAVLLDMIGDRDLTLTIPKNSSPPLTARLFAAARAEGKRSLFSLYSPMLDDHTPFLAQGIPAIDIIDFYYGSSPRQNDYWHTNADSIDKISPESLETVGRITVLLLNSLIAKPLY